MKKITVAGAGYVGIANAVLLAQHNDVTIYDISNDKIALLQKRVSPIKDKEIEEYLQHDLTLSAVADKRAAYAGADFVVVATPTDYDSEKFFFDTKSVEAVIHDVEQLAPRSVVVIKSTVPVGFTQRMCAAHPALKIIFSPEFLREGKALYDNLYPSRIIVGGVSSEATQFGALLLEGAAKKETPVLYMQPTESEAV
jgi:UDPglucose 6-dehydrogenase